MIALAAMPVDIQPEYSRLLSGTLPSVIESEEQNERYLAQISELLQHEGTLTRAEREFVKLLTLLIEDFEEKNYAMPKTSAGEMLAFLMDQHGLESKDLVDVFGSASSTNDALAGKQEFDKEQIRRLSERFGVSPELFF